MSELTPLARRSHQSDTATATARIQFREWRPILISVWICHFAASIFVLIWGSLHYTNEDRKYIPIDANAVAVALGDDAQCSKAYSNVWASGIAEDSAIICCTTQGESNDGICQPSPWYLFFARRLAKLPEAWLLPLFPLMIRGLIQFVTRRPQQEQEGGTNDGTASKRRREINALAMRRFWLYFGLIQLRGWVLYLLFDSIENRMVEPAGDTCWYDSMLRSNQSACEGTVTDYSDHVVLFFGQILPIPLTEVLFSFVAPFWSDHATLKTVVPTLLVTGLLYIYGIVFFAAYNTAAYFHTQYEIIVGYLITLWVQIPLFLLLTTSLLLPTREYFFGPGM